MSGRSPAVSGPGRGLNHLLAAMRISLLLADLSRNCVARAYQRVKVLERHFEVEVVGPVMGKGIFPPFQGQIPCHPVYPGRLRFPDFSLTLWRLFQRVRGDVVYALQPRLASFGPALLSRLGRKTPVVLEVFDWDAEPFLHQPFRRKLTSLLRRWPWPQDALYDGVMERFISLADKRLVGSEFLQKRYGGTRLYHGVNCRLFRPGKYDSRQMKEKWGLAGKTVILFGGTALPHKGLEDLIAAVQRLKKNSLRILLFGSGGYIHFLKQLAGETLVSLGAQPYPLLPQFLDLGDLVVLPQRNTPYAQAQIPAKLFDAMAMAKPILATAVSDLPEILAGCGWIVEAGRPERLEEGIDFILRHPGAAADMGRRARQRCLEHYSWEALDRILTPIFQGYSGAPMAGAATEFIDLSGGLAGRDGEGRRG